MCIRDRARTHTFSVGERLKNTDEHSWDIWTVSRVKEYQKKKRLPVLVQRKQGHRERPKRSQSWTETGWKPKQYRRSRHIRL